MNIQANSSTCNTMSWADAFAIVHKSIELDAQRAERDAEYYEDSHNPDPENFSHAFAAEQARERAAQLREAFQVIARGF
jgi:hypothetical protein